MTGSVPRVLAITDASEAGAVAADAHGHGQGQGQGQGNVPLPTFREVFEAHVRYVWRSLLGLGVNEADVPDASQQVFLVVHARLTAQRVPAGALRTFVYGVCLRVAADFRGRAHRRHERLCATPPEPVTVATQEQTVGVREALQTLETVLAQLPAPQRDAFVLYEIEELEMAEVASALGCPLQTAYSRLHAARKCVMVAFAEAGDDVRSAAARRNE
jgi:RNA polymerase sigma-70 factor (ECF subfamily)